MCLIEANSGGTDEILYSAAFPFVPQGLPTRRVNAQYRVIHF